MVQDFTDFMELREAASTAFVEGDPRALIALSTQTSPATIFGPKGDAVSGADRVNRKNERDARMFVPSGKNRFEIFHISADSNLAYWTGIQHSSIHMKGDDGLVPMDLRVTEIFRLENGNWKLIHRHADALKSTQ